MTDIENDSNTLKDITVSWSIILIIISIAIILVFILFYGLKKLNTTFPYRFMWTLFAVGVILAIIFGVIWFIFR